MRGHGLCSTHRRPVAPSANHSSQNAIGGQHRALLQHQQLSLSLPDILQVSAGLLQIRNILCGLALFKTALRLYNSLQRRLRTRVGTRTFVRVLQDRHERLRIQMCHVLCCCVLAKLTVCDQMQFTATSAAMCFASPQTNKEALSCSIWLQILAPSRRIRSCT